MKQLFAQYEQSRSHTEGVIDQIAHLVHTHQAPTKDLIDQATILLSGLLSRYNEVYSGMVSRLGAGNIPPKRSTVPEYQAAWEQAVAGSHQQARALLEDVCRITSASPHYADAAAPLLARAQELLDGLPEQPEAPFTADLSDLSLFSEACHAGTPLPTELMARLETCGDLLPRPVIFGLLLSQYALPADPAEEAELSDDDDPQDLTLPEDFDSPAIDDAPVLTDMPESAAGPADDSPDDSDIPDDLSIDGMPAPTAVPESVSEPEDPDDPGDPVTDTESLDDLDIPDALDDLDEPDFPDDPGIDAADPIADPDPVSDPASADEPIPADVPEIPAADDDPYIRPIEPLRPLSIPSEQKLEELCLITDPVLCMLVLKLSFFGMMDIRQMSTYARNMPMESLQRTIDLLVSRGYVAGYAVGDRIIYCHTPQMDACIRKPALAALLRRLTKKNRLPTPSFIAADEILREDFIARLERVDPPQALLRDLRENEVAVRMFPSSYLNESADFSLSLARPGMRDATLLFVPPEALATAAVPEDSGAICHSDTLPDMDGVTAPMRYCLCRTQLYLWRDGSWACIAP